MKTLNFLLTLILVLSLSCTKSGGSCGSHSGHSLHKGPDGGCYYINDNGNKTYVDRDECHC